MIFTNKDQSENDYHYRDQKGIYSILTCDNHFQFGFYILTTRNSFIIIINNEDQIENNCNRD